MTFRERLAILGGADPIDPLEPNNGVRHAAVGGLLICVAAWAWAAAGGMLHSSLKAPWPVAIFGGLLIAAVIFFIDVLITCTPLKADKARYRARVILIRGMISLAMGLAISHATILVMYRDTLAQIVSAKNHIVAQAEANRIRAHSQWPPAIADAQKQIAGYRRELQAANKSYAAAQAELDRSRTAWLNDRLCINGTQRASNGDWCGNGNVANPLRHTYETLNENFPAVQRSHSRTVTSLDTAITTENNTITTDTNNLNAEIQNGIRADLDNVGLAAQSEALWTLLSRDVFLWLWPVFFIVIDLAVALMKGILPESDFDRRRRRERERDDTVNEMANDSPVWSQVAVHIAGRSAEVATARADAIAEREIASLRSRQAPPPPQPARSRRKKLAWAASITTSVAITLVLTVTTSLGQPSSANVGLTVDGGQSINLHGGEKLTVPVGAVSGNAPVTATYTATQGWPGSTPASDEVKFSSAGTITGGPVLSLHVPDSERQLALTGALHLAFRSPNSGEWIPYPATFNTETDTMVAVLTHFSTWRFWRWNWASDLAHISRAVGAWKGRRAISVPYCDNRSKPPTWYRSNAGIGNGPALAVRGCVEGHAGGVLDVQLVNNRPYGLILAYGHTAVKWGWHAPPHTLADTLRDAIGDYAAHAAGGLYLPPLSRASVGIMNIGAGKHHGFAITPANGTILGDALDMSLGSLTSQPASATSAKWAKNIVTTAVSGPCTKAATRNNVGSIPTQPAVMKLLSGLVLSCLKHMLTMAAENELPNRDGITSRTVRRLSAAANSLEDIIFAGKWSKISDGLDDVLNFSSGSKPAAKAKLGFGFTVLASHAHGLRRAGRSVAQPA